MHQGVKKGPPKRHEDLDHPHKITDTTKMDEKYISRMSLTMTIQ